MKILDLNNKYGKSTILFDLVFFIVLLVLILFSAFTTEYWLTICEVQQNSMQQTLNEGDIIIVDKLAKIDRYDVIVFKDEKGELVVKRVLAMGGETIYCENSEVYVEKIVNGQVVKTKLNEVYLKETTTNFEKVKVDNGEFFVVGDNRDVSYDSRAYGPIKKSQVKGVVHQFFIDNKQFITNFFS